MRPSTIVIALAIAIVSRLPGEMAGSSSRPNIVFILADDLGWTDLNCTEGPEGAIFPNGGGAADSRFYHTPNIARLRHEGMRFTRAYASAPYCGPSRVSILTGKYPARLKFTNNTTHNQEQGNGPFPLSEMNFTEPVEPDLVRNLDPRSETLIANALRGGDGDFLSCLIGKWHVHQEGVEDMGPEAHGFDFNVGGSFRGSPGREAGRSYYRGDGWDNIYFPNLERPHERYSGRWPVGPDVNSNGVNDRFEGIGYLTDALTFRALEFIELAWREDRPFFLYLSHYGVHAPMQAKRRDGNGDGRITPDDPEQDAVLFEGRWGRDGRHEIDLPGTADA